MKRILIVGHGRAGKDVALEYLASITGLRNAGTTSLYLAKYVATDLGVTPEVAYATRHADRDVWYRVGRQIRENNPGVLLREALLHGEMTGGLRDAEECVVARDIVDLIVWVENNRVAPDPTVMFGPEVADVVIENHGTMDEYRLRLRRLAAFAGLVRSGE